MRESISYTFLLNIVIVFIFTCAAIIMGILSYYKAFRANTIISESIEKYEGYNCLAKEEIARKLTGIGYRTPFDVKCKSSDGKCDDSGEGYKVISYNLDFEGNLVYEDEPMNSTYQCEIITTSENVQKNNCTTNKHYQYGITTYMYVELPVVSGLIRIPLFTKTSIMYDYRNYYVDGNQITDVEQLFDKLYTKTSKNGKIYVTDAYYGNPITIGGEITTTMKATDVLGDKIFGIYKDLSTNQSVGSINEGSFMDLRKDGSNSYRDRLIYKKLLEKNGGIIDAVYASQIWATGVNGEYTKDPCGTKFDYSKINY